MKIYAGAMSAQQVGNFITAIKPCAVRAKSEKSAQEKTMAEALKAFPVEHGFKNHWVGIVLIPPQWTTTQQKETDE